MRDLACDAHRYLYDPTAGHVELEGWSRSADLALCGDHPGRGGRLFRDRVDHTRHDRQQFRRGGRRGHRDDAFQCDHPHRRAGTRRAVLIDPDRRAGAGISGSRVSHRGALGAGRQHQRLRRSAHRVVSVRDHQLDFDGDPGRRSRRDLLCTTRSVTADGTLWRRAASGQAWSSFRSMAWRTRFWRVAFAPARSIRWQAGCASGRTSCRAGKPCCRR